MNNKPLHILLVYDDEANRLIFKEALEELEIRLLVHTVNNGIELMAYLTKKNAVSISKRKTRKSFTCNEAVTFLL